MDYVLVSYRSRENTLKFSQILSKNGIANQVVNTPKEAGVGCGLSVKVSSNYFYTVKRIAFSLPLKSFAGFFGVKRVGNKRIVKSI